MEACSLLHPDDFKMIVPVGHGILRPLVLFYPFQSMNLKGELIFCMCNWEQRSGFMDAGSFIQTMDVSDHGS
jgi:hypothetical protein